MSRNRFWASFKACFPQSCDTLDIYPESVLAENKAVLTNAWVVVERLVLRPISPLQQSMSPGTIQGSIRCNFLPPNTNTNVSSTLNGTWTR